MAQDKYISWRPSASEQKPPAHPYAQSCFNCRKEYAERMPLNESSGTVQEWLEQLSEIKTIVECIDWWNTVNTIQWDRPSTLEIGSVYVRHLANLKSLDYWEKPFKGSCGLDLKFARRK